VLDQGSDQSQVQIVENPILEQPASLENSARLLAEQQQVSRQSGDAAAFIQRAKEHYKLLSRAHEFFSRLAPRDYLPSVAAEWLLDNFYLIQKTVRQVQTDLPEKFYRELPKLSAGPLKGNPRVYEIAFEIIRIESGRVDLGQARKYLSGFQEVTPLNVGELWALPTMLRIGILDVLAYAMSQDLKGNVLEGASSFHATDFLAGIPDGELVANAVLSLRALLEEDWKEFFETVSLVEQVLGEDPANLYKDLDFESRDLYRKEVEALAWRSSWSEVEVARQAVGLAEEIGRTSDENQDLLEHVGYYLLGEGRSRLEGALEYRPSTAMRFSRWLLTHPTGVYLGSIFLLLILGEVLVLTYGAGWGAAAVQLLIIALLTLIPLLTISVSLVNWLVTNLVPPRSLPKIDFQDGIPERFRTFVVIPTLISGREEIDELLRQLEQHYLGNNDRNLLFGLLTDFSDADQETLPEDQDIIDYAVAGITRLNVHYQDDGRVPFYFFHRLRTWNAGERLWMGWERKRGKLDEFNRLLRGKPNTFAVKTGDLDDIYQVRFVITLDTDTGLPPGTARRLVGTLAHPLNRPRFAPGTNQIVSGYTVLQPRTAIKLPSSNQSLFARYFSGDRGIDLYTLAVSDVYQDLFAEGIYIGKGIYDVDAFTRSLAGQVPEYALLSHDLYEGIQGRAALVSDIILLEDYPPNYLTYAHRLHRWVRGDWQLLPWLFAWVPYSARGRIRNRISLIDRWKILDNLRRSLVSTALLLLFFAAWTGLPGPVLFWMGLAFLTYGVPFLTSLVSGLLAAIKRGNLGELGVSLSGAGLRWLFAVVFIPYEALMNADAVGTVLVRMYVTRRHLLQWTTAAHTISLFGRQLNLLLMWRQMYAVSVLSAGMAVLIAWVKPASLMFAAPLLAAWFFLPILAYRIGQPITRREVKLSDSDLRFLRRTARCTWLFFEHFIGPQDNWLPPDHFQEHPRGVVAHRTSPTNIGLMLVSALSANDLGYLGLTDLSLRFQNTFRTLHQMERYRGHFLNWYNTETLETLPVRYVSTVDSGNLAASLWVVRQACLKAAQNRVWNWLSWQGLLDILDLIESAAQDLVQAGGLEGRPIRQFLEQARQSIFEARNQPGKWPSLLILMQEKKINELGEILLAAIESATSTLDEAALNNLRTWTERANSHLLEMRRDVEALAPWLFLEETPTLLQSAEPGTALASAWSDLKDLLFSNPSLGEIPGIEARCREVVSRVHLIVDKDGANQIEIEQLGTWFGQLEKALQEGHRNALDLLQTFNSIAGQAEVFVQEMDFGFLFDDQRELFHIGYNLEVGELDHNHYDLLASEARLASLLAIAKGDVPQSHWLHLARPVTQVDGTRSLVSWSGTMFEYLMPALFTCQYENSLLAVSNRGAVRAQIEYAHRLKLPWGISESGYYLFDSHMNYQYQAFGVPELAYKRGLGEEQVIAPYASLLALSLEPQAVLENLHRLLELKAAGDYGFYEAIDFTPSRLPSGERYAVVRSFMSHHEGMVLLSLANFLAESQLERRFHADPRIQSFELLLQEQISYQAPVERPPQEAADILPGRPHVEARPWPVPISTPSPTSLWLSNGRFSVLVTNGGGGLSRWKNKDLTRWRADSTLDGWGTWVYVRDLDHQDLYSVTQQPVPTSKEQREVQFAPHMASFRSQVRQLSMLEEVTVPPTEDLEIRRLIITNHSAEKRRLLLASYGEVVLAEHKQDQRHPAFNKLFIESEYLPEERALLFQRRLRESSEEPLFLAHALLPTARLPEAVFWETDRLRFLGRGGSRDAPLAITSGAFSGTTGATLDPIFSLGTEILLEPHATAQVVFLTAAGPTRQAVLEAISTYQNRASVEQAFAKSRTRAEIEMRQLEVDSEQLALYQKMLSFLLYPYISLRAGQNILDANHEGQPTLWAYSISGDNPIVLVRVSNQDEVDLVEELLRAHAYWRRHNLVIDLVILNQEPGGYQDDLANALKRLVAASEGDVWQNRPGGIFLLGSHFIPQADQILLESAARVVLDGSLGTLEAQLARHEGPPPLPELVPMAEGWAPSAEPLLEKPENLLFDNGLGGFSPDGREYVIYLRPGEWTPAPWVNVIANPEFGFMVSEAGGGNTWAVNSGENRLTPWFNDPVRDSHGEAIYLRDEETGEIWSPTPLPIREEAPYLVRHGAGYTTFAHHSHGLIQQTRMFVPLEDPVKIIQLRLTNTWSQTRRITITYYAEWVLGTAREDMQPFIIPEFDVDHQALLARNPYNIEFGERVAFLAPSKEAHGLTADRTEFLGRLGSRQSPAALHRVGLASTVVPGVDPCAAIQLHVDLPPGGSDEVYFLLGEGKDRKETHSLMTKYQDASQVQTAWEQLGKFWEDLLGRVQVKTPEPAMDILMNRWLLYQDLSCRLWGRSALYQSSGAYGFRDQLQDVLALLHARPEIARQHILEAAEHQFESGDVLHWWHPPSGRGLRTRISDNLLWLPFVTARYIQTTGDRSILDEKVPFLVGTPLEPDEKERYIQSSGSTKPETLFEHCRRAIQKGDTAGRHGLPLIGSGDWNDGMNRVGDEGLGESVWLGWFLYEILVSFAPICRHHGESGLADQFEERARDLRQCVEANAWDGSWYRRAYFDDGSVLGSAKNRECQIDSLSQSWAVLSEGGDRSRVIQAMESVAKQLVLPEDRLILLFRPPFNHTPRDPGYIKGYPPGIRENGGQYTHAALWAVWAFAELGQTDRGLYLFQLINPILLSDTQEKVWCYQVEPYVLAADVYGVAPHTGRGGWTWYTGSAGWMYRLGLEGLLGLRRRGDTLSFEPCIPPDWPAYNLSYQYGSSQYQIRVDNSNGTGKGVQSVEVDGELLANPSVQLQDDGQLHQVILTLG
jgi:cyclic beta-1,2-glucan glucanotransferase